MPQSPIKQSKRNICFKMDQLKFIIVVILKINFEMEWYNNSYNGLNKISFDQNLIFVQSMKFTLFHTS